MTISPSLGYSSHEGATTKPSRFYGFDASSGGVPFLQIVIAVDIVGNRRIEAAHIDAAYLRKAGF